MDRVLLLALLSLARGYVRLNGVTFKQFNKVKPSTDPETCKAMCQKEQDCIFWSWTASKETCGMTTDVGQIRVRRGVHSGSNYGERCGITGLGVVGQNVLKSSRVPSECDRSAAPRPAAPRPAAPCPAAPYHVWALRR